MGIVERVLRARPQVSTPAAAGVQAAPFQFYVSGEDTLRLRSWSSIVCTIAVEGRWLTDEGLVQVFRYTFTTNGAPSNAQEFAIPPQGTYLLNVVCDVLTPITMPGQCYVQLLIGRGDAAAFIKLGTVLQGYVGTGKFLAFPGSPLEDSLSGPGFVYTRTLGALISGEQWNAVVPASQRWKVHRIIASFTTSAVVGTRTVGLDIMETTTIVARLASGVRQIASAGYLYTWAPGIALADGTNVGCVNQPIPTPCMLDALQKLQSAVGAMATGDLWSDVHFQVEEWLVVDSTPTFTL